jgi:predicted dehydrogenase
MKQMNVGVIGAGYWGPNLIRNFVEIPGSNLVGVADLRPDRLKHIQARYPRVHVTDDYWELFSMGVDAVVVATPPTTHYKIARNALEHDLHVLVEKPLALSSEEALDLIKLADERDRTLMVGHTFEYNTAVRVLKEIIDSGELGEILYIDSVRVNLGLFQPNLNVVWDLAPHDISILHYILGQEPVRVSAHGSDSIVPGKHDIAYLNLEFPDSVLAHIRVSWLDPTKVRRTTVVGSRKMVVYDDVETMERIKIYDKGVEAPRYTDTFDEFQFSYRQGDVVIPSLNFTEPLRAECEHFLESARNGNRPQSDGYSGWKVVRVLEAADRSLKDGGCAQTLEWRLEDIRAEDWETGNRIVMEESPGVERERRHAAVAS